MLNKPLNPWFTVGAGAIATGLGAGPVVSRALVVIGPLIIAAYNWPRLLVSIWLAMFMFSSGLGLVLFGRHVSRYGVRAPSIVYLAIFGLFFGAVAVLPPVQTLFLLVFFVVGVAGAAACAMPYMVAISAAFTEKRGLALGILSTGAAVLIAVLPSLSAQLLVELGWRNATIALAALASIVPIMGLALFVRTPPGIVAAGHPHAGVARSDDRTYLGDRNFWLIFVAMLGISFGGMGFSLNIFLLLKAQGLSTVDAAWAFSLGGLISLIGRPIVGWALDRFFAPYVSAIVFMLCAAGIAIVMFGGVGVWMYLGVSLIQLSVTEEGMILSYLVSRYFSVELLGKVNGVMWLAYLWGAGLGTYFIGKTFDVSGSYAIGAWIMSAVIFVATAALLVLPAYRVTHADAPERLTGFPIPKALSELRSK